MAIMKLGPKWSKRALTFYSEIINGRDPDREDSEKKRRANYTGYNQDFEGTQVPGLIFVLF